MWPQFKCTIPALLIASYVQKQQQDSKAISVHDTKHQQISF